MAGGQGPGAGGPGAGGPGAWDCVRTGVSSLFHGQWGRARERTVYGGPMTPRKHLRTQSQGKSVYGGNPRSSPSYVHSPKERVCMGKKPHRGRQKSVHSPKETLCTGPILGAWGEDWGGPQAKGAGVPPGAAWEVLWYATCPPPRGTRLLGGSARTPSQTRGRARPRGRARTPGPGPREPGPGPGHGPGARPGPWPPVPGLA